jgi:hypothetical protein
MFLIQVLIPFYYKHPLLDLLKKKTLFLAYTRKSSFNIDGTTIHSSLFIPFNYKDLPSLSLERLDNLIKK